MDWISQSNQVLQFIEKHLCEEIQMDELSHILASPAATFQRFFMLTTGITLTDYIRRRRLSRAAEELVAGKQKIIDLAIKYGYGSSDSFCTAFKRSFGMTPSEARKSGAKLEAYPYIIFSLTIIRMKGDVIVKQVDEINIVQDGFELFRMPAVRIIGRETRTGGKYGYRVIEMLEEAFASDAWKAAQAIPRVLKDELGWTCEYEAETDSYVYMVCFVTLPDTPVPKGCTFRDIPGTICAKGILGESIEETVRRASQHGYIPNWSPHGWNAERVIDGDDRVVWLVPVIEQSVEK
jgi:AraC-like DNA-binding protein